MIYRVLKGIFLFLILVVVLTACIEAYTPTATPSESAQITDAPSFQKTPTTAEVTIIPTLSAQDIHLLLSQLLQAGNECRLPCWWNLIPGSSTVQDAEKVLEPFLSMATYDTNSSTIPSGIFLKYPIEDLVVLFRLGYSPSSSRENEIELIQVRGEVVREIPDGYEPIYDDPVYSEMFDQYMIPSILSTYGPPAEVALNVEIGYAEPTSPDIFTFRLLYPQHGAILSYFGSAEVTSDMVRVCPVKTFVGLLLTPLDRSDLFQEHSAMSPLFKPVEEATGMTVEEFYQVFRQPTDQCLETPLILWPP